jgi:hypothetical protein
MYIDGGFNAYTYIYTNTYIYIHIHTIIHKLIHTLIHTYTYIYTHRCLALQPLLPPQPADARCRGGRHARTGTYVCMYYTITL